MAASVEAQAIPSLSSYVRGKDIESGRWVYVLSARAVLEDSFASLTLKRRLESGRVSPDEVPEGVIAGRVALADEATVEDAVQAAAEATKIWRAAPLSVRFDGWMELLRATIEEHQDELVRLLTLEGHPLELAKWEISGMRELTRPESAAYLRGQLHQEFTVGNRRNIVRRQPDGVVCITPPANAPLVSALLGSMCLPGGNAAVVRAPRTAPYGVTYALRHIIAPILDQLGAPPGLLNVVCGNPAPMLDAWIRSPLVDDVLFFGDVPNGLKLERRCVEAGKKPILELAGNDAVVVWKDADLDGAADALAESFYGSGQLCMIPNQAIVHPEVADALIERVAERAQRLRPGYPDQEGVLLSPVLRHDKFHDFLNDAVDKGATVVTGGHGMQLDGTVDDSAGFFLQPTVLRVDGLKDAREVRAVREETFFPLLPIVVPESADDEALLDACVEYVNSNEYGLRNSLWTRDQEVVDRFVAHTVTGGLLKVNDSHIAFTAPLPSHGGTGLTGGAFGEANYPVLRTTHLQGVSVVIKEEDSVAVPR
ncbi:aldehyde dehydrogenase family protein [Streptomyces sp. FBKL.4005]|uniref:aldehyde dehydrogenase family protein n=1 Tax=Streptomyces sp. FBKL.4005 TaxID=2015515 RepID=UPI001CB97B45|nr:aldehyde dehydrogenase [Streptomyces sp. FBKL.4005]